MNKQISILFSLLISLSFGFSGVCAASSWPEGKADIGQVEKNKSITINVLANDIGEGLKISLLDAWTDKNGQISADSAQVNITYTPALDFVGEDIFWYAYVDDQGRENFAVVNITVTDTTNPPSPPSPPSNNEWPTGVADSATTGKNKAINLLVLNNDIGNNLRIIELDPWTENAGEVRLNAAKNSINYNPAPDFIGTDTFWYTFVDDQNRDSYAEVKVNVKSAPTEATRFSHVKMHYGLLNNRSMVWREVGSIPPYTSAIRNINLSKNADKGDSQLTIQSNVGLVEDQLITYFSTNGKYYVGQVKQLTNTDTIVLTKPLEADIASGNNAWNFYGNPSHPNKYGYRAIVDFAMSTLKLDENTQGKHLLLGDSWFDNDHFSAYLSQKLPNTTIVNEGIGGNTTNDLVKRFDADVSPESPDYVWIISGANDYWKGVTTAKFKSNVNTLLEKSKAIGAKVILIDSSVGESVGPTGIANKLQSEEYVNAVLELNQ